MIRTTEIRPGQAHAEYNRLLEQERRRFVDASGRLRSRCAVRVDCPACQGAGRRPYDSDSDPAPPTGNLWYQECTRCGCVYADPRLSGAALEEYVRHSQALGFFHEHILLATEATRRERIFRPQLELLRRLAPTGRVLELGSAVGTFLSMLVEANYRAEGIELCRFSVAHNRAAGRCVYDRPIERLDLPAESYDAVCAWCVLCHLADPAGTLEAVYAVLRPGGVLALSTTNVHSFEYLTLRTRYMNPFVFYQYFTPSAMTRLVCEAGFVDCEIDTPGETDVQSVRDILGKPDPALGDFLNHVVFDESPAGETRREALQRFLAAHQLSGHMVVTARKPA